MRIPSACNLKRKITPMKVAKRKNGSVGALVQKGKPSMKMGNASKPISLHPLKFDAAVAALLKVKPQSKKTGE